VFFERPDTRARYGGGGGIVGPIVEWEVEVGERWYVSCYWESRELLILPKASKT
jgi:hypothetical protein